MTPSIDPHKAAEAYGSFKAWSRRLDIPYTTVIGWRDAGKVPDWRTAHVLEIAREDDKDIVAKPKAKRQAA